MLGRLRAAWEAVVRGVVAADGDELVLARAGEEVVAGLAVLGTADELLVTLLVLLEPAADDVDGACETLEEEDPPWAGMAWSIFSFVTNRSIRADREAGARSAGSVHVNLYRIVRT